MKVIKFICTVILTLVTLAFLAGCFNSPKPNPQKDLHIIQDINNMPQKTFLEIKSILQMLENARFTTKEGKLYQVDYIKAFKMIINNPNFDKYGAGVLFSPSMKKAVEEIYAGNRAVSALSNQVREFITTQSSNS